MVNYIVYFSVGFEHHMEPNIQDMKENTAKTLRLFLETFHASYMKLKGVDSPTAWEAMERLYPFATLIHREKDKRKIEIHIYPKPEYTEEELKQDWKLLSRVTCHVRPKLGLEKYPEDFDELPFELPEKGKVVEKGVLRIERS